MELLRVATAGSVDDGKSTLIGRLLLDSKQIFEDQLEAVERTSREKGFDYTNLALLTDGLRAEREQGITIDVAYRYFATPRRKFIIADTPGHVQYTRNMVTGASTVDLAMILLDARKGSLEQSRRHAVIASLLQVRHLVLCVNKMDLVDFDQDIFERISDEFTDWAAKLAIPDLTFIPISALHGDNVTQHSPNTPWYGGPTLLHHLEHVYIGSDRNLIDSRFPVQWVVRPMSNEWHDYRGYAGEVAGGIFRPGDEVMILPSGLTTTIEGIDLYGTQLEEAMPPQSVTMRLADNLDVSRGDMICRPQQRADGHPGDRRDDLLVQRASAAGTVQVRAEAHDAERQVPGARPALPPRREHARTATRPPARSGMNDMGRVSLRITEPLFVDEYRRNRTTGSFILVDEGTNETVGAGMVLGTTD